MRIVILADRLILGGLETHIITFTNELLRRGHRIFLYTAHTEPDILSQIKAKSNSFQYLFWREDPAKDLVDFRPDIIHAHPFTAIIKGYELAQAFKRPLVITMHGLYDFGLDRSPLGNLISDKAHAVIAVDQAVAGILQNCTPHPEKVVIIHNGIDLSFFVPQILRPFEREKYDLTPEWHTITVISRFDDGKERSIIQFLRIARDLANGLNGLNIMIVGDGSWFSHIQALVDELNIIGKNLKIYLAGRQNDVRSFIGIADLVLACDRAALEAMACMRPVYAMNGSGFAGAIDSHNFQAVLLNRSNYFPIRDQELVTQLLSLVQDESERYQVARRGLEIIRRYFNITDCTSQLERVFRRSLARKTK